MYGSSVRESNDARRRLSIEMVAQFSTLVHARETGDPQAKKLARRELRRLGVKVTFGQVQEAAT